MESILILCLWYDINIWIINFNFKGFYRSRYEEENLHYYSYAFVHINASRLEVGW